MSIKFNSDHLKGFVEEKEIKAIEPQIQQAHQQLEKRISTATTRLFPGVKS